MAELQNLEDLLSQLLRGIQDVIQSGEILTDEFQGILAQELEYLITRIDELKSGIDQVEPITSGPPILEPGTSGTPDLEPGPFPSSNINSFKYNPATQQLYIKFHGKDSAGSGPTYSYQNVPQFIYDVFRRGAVGPKTSGRNRYHTWHKNILPSLGAAAYALIKQGKFPFKKVA